QQGLERCSKVCRDACRQRRSCCHRATSGAAKRAKKARSTERLPCRQLSNARGYLQDSAHKREIAHPASLPHPRRIFRKEREQIVRSRNRNAPTRLAAAKQRR